jgi:hypothetical protein
MAFLLLLLFCLPLGGDIIHLKGGRNFEGQVVEESDDQVRLRIQEGIFLTVKREQIEKIDKRKTPFELCQEKLAEAKTAKNFETVLKYFQDEKLRSQKLFSKIKEGLVSARKKEHPKTFCRRCNAWGEIDCSVCGGKGYKEEPCNLCDEKGMVLCSKCEGSGKVTCYECAGRKEVSVICGRCAGRGYVRCYSCRGDGWVTCARCDGEGTLRCFTCRGDGFFRCKNCRGRGKITERERVRVWDEEEGWTWVWRDVERTCPTCGGVGELACPVCGGSGYLRCGRCHGSGGWLCEICRGGGRLRCESCDGRGRVIETCRMCQGTGWLFCSLCKGKSHITCPKCGGTKIARIPCQNCKAKGAVICPECGGSGIKKQEAAILPEKESKPLSE